MEINLKIYFAPMEGLTDYMYRNAYDEFFGQGKIDKYFMPFISPNKTDKFLAKEMRDIDRVNNQTVKSIPQVMTNNHRDFVWTARLLHEQFGYDEINLNAGCPSGTVVSKNKGAGMLGDTDELERILYEIFSDSYILNNKIKISVKTRIGLESEDEWAEILKVYNKFKMEELIVHPRVRTDFYRNDIKYNAYKLALEESINPVCYNGDIFTADNYISFLERFGDTKRVMLGRGLVTDPGLINVISSDNPKNYKRDTVMDLKNMKKLHDSVYEQRLKIMSGDKHAIHRMKEMWCYMEYIFPENKKEIKAIKKSQTMGDYKDAVNVFFNTASIKEPRVITYSRKF